MANLINTNGFVSNPQFSGGEAITPLSGAAFDYANQGYGGLYVGTAGTLVVKTINGNVLTLVSASGFIPGIIGAVSASSTAANIIGFDPKPVSFPTTTTSTSTTAAPTTSTTTEAPTTSTTAAPTTSTTTAGVSSAVITIYSGSYTGTPGSATITGAGAVCFNSIGPGFPGPVSESLFIDSSVTPSIWNTINTGSVQLYKDAGLTELFTGSAGIGNLTAVGRPSSEAAGGVVRFFNTSTNAFESAQIC